MEDDGLGDDLEDDAEEETAEAATDDKDEEEVGNFVWDEDESAALRQARKDAELTASADSVRAYLKQIGKVALLNASKKFPWPSASRQVCTPLIVCRRSRNPARSSPL